MEIAGSEKSSGNASFWDITSVQSILTIYVGPGRDLYDTMLLAARRANIRRGTIISGIGAVGPGTFRNVVRFPDKFPVTDNDRNYRFSKGPLELLALSGWIAERPDGTLYLHGHLAASTVEREDVTVLGGHLGPGLVAAWIMVVISIAVHEPGGAYVDNDPVAQAENLLLDRSADNRRKLR